MLTIEDIRAHLASPEKENMTIELKSVRKFYDSKADEQSKKRNDIAAEIIALANRHGGKLVIGLNDDGSFDGKQQYTTDAGSVSVDDLKGLLNQICYDRITPRIEITTDVLRPMHFQGELVGGRIKLLLARV